MAFRRSLDFLPSFFRTETNSKFLNATLDQLISEPELKRLDGYIGRKFAPSYRSTDGYINESNNLRQNYQLEPSTIVKDDDGKVKFVSGYQDLISRINSLGGKIDDHSRLFASRQYTYDGLFDYDKFVNFSNYYWLPNGPDSVDVRSVEIPTEYAYTVTPPRIYQTVPGELDRESFDTTAFDVSSNPVARLREDGFKFTGYGDVANPRIRLARGGTYTFDLDQIGHGFYIQTRQGLNLSEPWQRTLSIRDVYGVINNGEDVGTLTFNVPAKNAQDFYINLPEAGTVSLISYSTTKNRQLRYVELQNSSYADLIANHRGIDSQRFIDGKTVSFLPDAALESTPVAWNAYTTYASGDLIRYGNTVYRVLTAFTSGRTFNDTNLEVFDAADDWYDPVPFDGDDYPFDTTNFDRGPSVAPEDKLGKFKIAVGSDGIIRLTPDTNISVNNKLLVEEGNRYGNRQIFRTANNVLELIPNITANLDFLYYQDSLDSNIYGVIEVIDQDNDGAIYVDESIVGKKNYTSPNGVKFTNGLKVLFRDQIIPASYAGKEYYVEGVGESITLTPVTDLVLPETWLDVITETFDVVGFDAGPYEAETNSPLTKDHIVINRSSLDQNPWSRINRWFHEDVITATAAYNNYAPVLDFTQRSKRPIIEFDPNIQLFDFGRRAKPPVDVIDVVVKDPNTGAKLAGTEDAFSEIEGHAVDVSDEGISSYYVDGIPLLNGTRVIFAGDTDPDVKNKIYQVSWIRPQSDTDIRRAIFTGDGSTSTFDMNFTVNDPINLQVLIDGQNANNAGYSWSINGQDLIFATTGGYSAPAAGEQITATLLYKQQIHLELVDDDIADNDTVIVRYGNTYQGKQLYVKDGVWTLGQTKSKVNQPPLFDLYDLDGTSLGDANAYPSNDFIGSKIFGYQESSTGTSDAELGLKLKYRNFNNVGDILFSDYITQGTVSYRVGIESKTKSTSASRARKNAADGTYQLINQWQANKFKTEQYQTQTYFATQYQRNLFELNVVPTDRTEPLDPASLLVFVNNKAINNNLYDIQLEGAQGYLLLDTDLAVGDKLDIKIATDRHNDNSVYEVPSSYDRNPLNKEIGDFTLGQLRDHITTVFENTPGLIGDFVGINNSRDLGNLAQYGGKILQNLGNPHLANLFLNDRQANFVEALLYSQREYARYKNKLLETLHNAVLTDPTNIILSLDEALAEMTANKNSQLPFYYSDMLGFGADYKLLTYKVSDPTIVTYDLTSIIDMTTPNGRAVNVYLNGSLLIKDLEYTIPTDRPVIELILDNSDDYYNLSTITLAVDDIIEIREYEITDGSHLPPTPTKLGLYPAFIPKIITDGRDGATRQMLRGHDGSLTALFGDHRDGCLLEFERRIYNNLKVAYTGDLHDLRDYVPGATRTTPYTKAEYDSLISGNFSSWLGKSGLQPTDFHTFDSNDPWTWNYNRTTSKIDGKKMPAAYWRGIFKYYFDTDAPHLRPWEMLGFADEPIWWSYYYGSAPFTRGNTVLWEDLSKGYIAAGDRAGYDARFARPNLIDYIPVDESGNMLSPLECLVKEYNSLDISGNFTLGDGGPVETAWRQSSEYPFAMQLALALMQPGEYFGANVDKNRQVLQNFGTGNDQWVYGDIGLRRDAGQLVHGEITDSGDVARVNGYVTWISEYAQALGLDRTAAVGDKLRGANVQLSYKMAGYTDKKLLKMYADQATPSSTNSSITIPDEDYAVVLTKSAPINSVTYSGVIITKTADGYTVAGYDDVKPYFTIETSATSGRTEQIKVGNASAVKYVDGTGQLLEVPYNTEFLSVDQTVDFLVSYGRYLTRQGFVFRDKLDEDAGFYKDWDLAAREFMFYVQQGWDQDIAISLSPVGNSARFLPALGAVDALTDKALESRVLTENYAIVKSDEYKVNRTGRDFRITIDGQSGIYLLDIDVVNYEHVLVFENTTRFNDIIYDPTLGSRQFRLKAVGYKTGDWDGSFGAAGFIINDDNVESWIEGKNYYKGELVKFKGAYYAASEDIKGSDGFDTQAWIKSDYEKINKGLLPNFSNKANQFKSFYDIDSVNLENDADRFGKGLIGLRPRAYLDDLRIADTSQVKFYQGMITQKGSKNSLDKLLRAKLDNFDGQINFYEDWAIKAGHYGATDIRQQLQLVINEDDATRNPVLIELLARNDQKVAGRISYKEPDIWAKAKPYDNNFLGTRAKDGLPEYLPNAGFARLDDVAWASPTVSELNNNVNIATALHGDLIYVAANLLNQWDILRIDETTAKAINLTIAQNGQMTIEFDAQHELAADDVIMIKTVNNQPAISGFYTVSATPSSTTITLASALSYLPKSKINGVMYKLVSQRFVNSGQILERQPILGWQANDRLFIDSATDAGWGVYEKQDAYQVSTDYYAADPLSPTLEPVAEANSFFGTSVAIDRNSNYMIVGQPGSNSICTFKVLDGVLIPDLTISSPSNSTQDFGARAAVSSVGLAAVSAPSSDSNTGYVFVLQNSPETGAANVEQALSSDGLETNGNFGESIAISNDGNWLVIGQPDLDSGYVYVYQLVVQTLPPPAVNEFIADGSSLAFLLHDEAADPQSIDSLQVMKGNTELEPYTDYDLTGNTLTLMEAPVAGTKITVTVTRDRPEQKFTGDGSTYAFELTGDSATPASIYNLKISVDGKLQVPFRDFTYASGVIYFTYIPDDQAGIIVQQKTHYTFVDAFTGLGTSTGDRFGASVHISSDGRRLVVGAPNQSFLEVDSSLKSTAGAVYVYERSAVKFVGDAETTSFPAQVTTSVTKVYVDEIEQVMDDGSGIGTYTLVGGSVIFSNAPRNGAIILIENNFILQTAHLAAPDPEAGAKLGTSVRICPTNCSIYSGAPYNDGSEGKVDAGKVYRFVNQGRFYGTIKGTKLNPTLTDNGYLIINDTWAAVSSGDGLADVIASVAALHIPGVTASDEDGYLRLSSDSEIATDKLKVTATDPAILSDLGLDVFVYQQAITNPDNEEFSGFGKVLAISNDAETLVIGSETASSIVPTTFDGTETYFDQGITNFVYQAKQSGAVFTYQYIGRPDDSLETPGVFIPAQRLVNDNLNPLDRFGASISISNDRIVVGAPGDDTYATNGGIVFSFKLGDYDKAWSLIRNQEPKVNIKLINRVSLIDTHKNEIITDLDFIDPFKGRIAGQAAQEISYRTAYDPAVYNVNAVGQSIKPNGVAWGSEREGEIWWDIGQTRWMEYEQGDIDFRTANWATAFPGSRIYCYEWTKSSLPPSQYSDANNPLSFAKGNDHVIEQNIDENGNINLSYYFWVGGKTATPDLPFRTMSSVDVEKLIANPKSTGLPYAAFVAPNAIALYNCKQFLRESDVVLSVDYDVEENESNIHAEYQLVSEGDAASKPTPDILTKLIDSLAGSDIDGRLVPDPYLMLGKRYGKEFRPRQSMFRDRDAAVKVAQDYINAVMAAYPILIDKDTSALLAQEPVPGISSGEYDDTVATMTERDYLNIVILPVGYRVLVSSDSSVDDRWTIYEVRSDGVANYWHLYRVQSYVNERYLDRIDWVADGETFITKTDRVIDFIYQLITVDPSHGTTVKVKDDGRGYYTIFKADAAGTWQPMIREKATVAINDKIWDKSITQHGYDLEGFDLQLFDNWPNIEVHNILRATYDKIFTLGQEVEKNSWFFMMMQHLLNEQKYVDWLFKSSFIKIEQRQRAIVQIPTYQRDNHDLVSDYINEVKPYHSKVREYIIRYDGNDSAAADATDFDVPAYYISETGRYRSPNGSETIDSFILDLAPYTAWRDNHTFGVGSIDVVAGGEGYFLPPQVVISGGGGSGATAEATVFEGSITSITVTNPGSGYTTTPTVTLEGISGFDAVVAARLSNNKIRRISSTIKFDRTSTPNAGFLVQFKDGDDQPVDIRSERISRVISEAGVIDYLLDLISRPDYDYDSTGDWLVSEASLASYPVASVPNYRLFPDASGRIHVLYQKKMEGWTAAALQDAIQAFGESVGANGLDISGTTVELDGSMTSFAPSVFAWAAETRYDVGDIVIYNNKAYLATDTVITGTGFADDLFVEFDASQFDNALDRTWAYYQPTAGQLGKDLGQLFTGVEYPGVKVQGANFNQEPGFDVAAYDIEPYDRFVIGPEGVKVLDPATLDQTLVSYFTDTELGTRPEDIITFGDGFVTPYTSHAPEEMIPGRVFDALDMKVYSTPSDDWTGEGLGLDIVVTSSPVGSSNEFSYVSPAGQVDALIVFSESAGRLSEGSDYTADRVNKTITTTVTLLSGDTLFIYAYDAGGEGLLYADSFATDGSTSSWEIPVDGDLIGQVFVSLDGNKVTDYTIGLGAGTSTIDFTTAPAADQYLVIHAFSSDGDQQSFTEIYRTETTLATANYPADYTITLDRQSGYAQPLADKIIVEVNKSRLRPPNQSYYTGDGCTSSFQLPDTVYVDPDDVIDAQIKVAIDGVAKQVNVDWTLGASDGSTIRSIDFVTAPGSDARITISFIKDAGYQMIGSDTILIAESLTLNPNDKIEVFTFTNHDKIGMRTQVFKGTTLDSVTVDIGYDDTGFDSVALDATTTVVSTVFNYELSRPVTKTSHLWVTLDVSGSGFGQRLTPNIDYRMLTPSVIQIGTGLGINPDSILVVTSFYETAQHPSLGFRIFHDLNGNVSYRRMNASTSTELAADLSISDSEISVNDASVLGEPSPSNNIPGVIFIGAERITYYGRDVVNNKLTQIRRGTAGTPILEHTAGELIVDGGLGEEIPNAHTAVWYDAGAGTASNGLGLQNSTTVQAKFLLNGATQLPLNPA